MILQALELVTGLVTNRKSVCRVLQPLNPLATRTPCGAHVKFEQNLALLSY